MRGVHDAEDVFTGHETEAGVSGLEIVNGLAHIAFSAENERRDAIVGIGYVFRFADL